uniref:Flavanone 4-reductase n=1 Tax=Tetraselmis sp. GSL018 TaxID=582737 RepID=A0A061RCX3_9CHLO|eukprot:CAMPEP_0177593090 /NCGR_PEP_ID=MMETSP0419_2-20121207/8933_1 /TAXON_ID=582737 /ORGANISM="Tetraselmis sp., Strain GSL018" /LENGTH=290 /DNA_ID=CAMNT_0019084051 /DNA_START=142 /DNA_END=1014 /DNA_ORIENTATION=+
MSRVSCVTGGTGFVATELIKQLLDKGCTVHTTVRCVEDVENPALSKLKSLSQALPGTLFFHKADLLSEGDFDEVVSACDVVYHTASPFGFFDSPDPQKDLIDPAVKGTINVLQSVVKNKESVKRVVLTSSVAAVHGEYASPPKSGDLYTEEDWNETSSLGNKQAYHLSKVLAEREAWRMAKEEGLDLVTVCPNFIIGPLTSPRADGVSVGFFKVALQPSPADPPADALAFVFDGRHARLFPDQTVLLRSAPPPPFSGSKSPKSLATAVADLGTSSPSTLHVFPRSRRGAE